MKTSLRTSLLNPRAIVGLALIAACGAASAFGVDIPAVVAAHPDLLAGLAGLGMIGETVDVKAVQASLDRVNEKVKEFGESFMAKASAGEKVTTDLKGQVDELLVKQGELRETLQQVEQGIAAIKKTGTGDQSAKSTGYALIEDEKFKAWAAKDGGQLGAKFNFATKAISSIPASAGVGIREDRLPGILMNPDVKLKIRDLVAPGRTNSNAISYMKENVFTNNAGMVAELGTKPESDLTFTEADTSVKKIAHFMKASSEILADFPQLQSIVDTRLRWGLDLIENGQLLNGSGVGNNLFGILPQATPYAAPIAIAGATRIDTLRLMLLQAELALYPSDGIVMHPTDWTAIELMKDGEGRYIFANPQGSINPIMWGRRVVDTVAIAQDTALVGAFKMGAQIFDRELANVVISTENEDDLIKNRVTILAEKRLAFAVYRGAAFVKNTNFDGSV